jgi:hypothetical protein
MASIGNDHDNERNVDDDGEGTALLGDVHKGFTSRSHYQLSVYLIVKFTFFFLGSIFTIISLAIFADKVRDVRARGSGFGSSQRCMLFIEDSGGYGNDNNCNFVITGEVFVFLMLVAVLVLNVVFHGTAFFSFMKIPHSAVAVILGLMIVLDVLILIFSFCTAIVISAGFSRTCQTMVDNTFSKQCDVSLPIDVHFYSSLQASVVSYIH